MTRRHGSAALVPWPVAAVAALVLTLSPALPAAALELVETPYYAEMVEAGTLPPIAERLPAEPLVTKIEGSGRSIGKPGGELHTLVRREREVRLMVVYGYARLVAYDRAYRIKPDILKAIDVEGGRIFTLHLRKGHKWSDGHPFTAEDFRYYWEDVANNEELSPAGPPVDMLVEGMPPKFEVIDEQTVRYTWAKPNPFFLANLAGASPLFIYRPAHYLKRFHIQYADMDALKAKIATSGRRNWAALHNSLDNLYKFDNPALPTLQPWMNTSPMPSTRFVGVRNPYYHRIDERGQQLPYLDRLILSVTDSKLIPAKSASGETDLQARGLSFSDFTVLKENEERSRYKVNLWSGGDGAHLALYPNLNVADKVWRTVMRDVRFRHALSLAIDRSLINNTLYFGLALESNNTALPDSPLFKPEYQTAWAEHDPERANKLLDEMGLGRGEGSTRRLPDGRKLELIVETAGESTEETDVLELIRDNWRQIGIDTFVKPSQREVFRNRIFAGETLMSIWSGYANGLPTASMSPAELAPIAQIDLQWPKWGQYYETSGKVGEPPDMPAAKELLELYRAWIDSDSEEEKGKIWQRMLEIHAQETFVIGIIAGVPQPVVVRNGLRNVPDKAVFAWDPGAFFGIYRSDTFWLDGAQ